VPLVDVALPLPLFRTFSYRVPGGPIGCVEPGARVVVPFRNRREIGIVLGAAEPRDGITYKDLLAAPDAEPSVDPPMLALCRWIAEYYLVPLGVALRCALPAALTGAGVPVPVQKTRRVLQLGHELPSRVGGGPLFARAPQQRARDELRER
jgi:primosomal protein N' (replication factor Y)